MCEEQQTAMDIGSTTSHRPYGAWELVPDSVKVEFLSNSPINNKSSTSTSITSIPVCVVVDWSRPLCRFGIAGFEHPTLAVPEARGDETLQEIATYLRAHGQRAEIALTVPNLQGPEHPNMRRLHDLVLATHGDVFQNAMFVPRTIASMRTSGRSMLFTNFFVLVTFREISIDVMYLGYPLGECSRRVKNCCGTIPMTCDEEVLDRFFKDSGFCDVVLDAVSFLPIDCCRNIYNAFTVYFDCSDFASSDRDQQKSNISRFDANRELDKTMRKRAMHQVESTDRTFSKRVRRALGGRSPRMYGMNASLSHPWVGLSNLIAHGGDPTHHQRASAYKSRAELSKILQKMLDHMMVPPFQGGGDYGHIAWAIGGSVVGRPHIAAACLHLKNGGRLPTFLSRKIAGYLTDVPFQWPSGAVCQETFAMSGTVSAAASEKMWKRVLRTEESVEHDSVQSKLLRLQHDHGFCAAVSHLESPQYDGGGVEYFCSAMAARAGVDRAEWERNARCAIESGACCGDAFHRTGKHDGDGYRIFSRSRSGQDTCSGKSKAPESAPAPGAAAPAAAPTSATLGQYTYAQLKGNPCEVQSDIDVKVKETYLSDAEFQDVFKMDRTAFGGQPGWKKKKAKVGAGLF